MAFTRKFLAALGIEADKIDEIIDAHVDVVNSLKAERDSYKADAEALPGVQKELDDLKASSGDGKEDAWKVKYDALKEDFDTYKADVEKKAANASKTEAYTALLKEVGISDKRIASVVKVADIDSIELDKDGKIKDADTLKQSLATEWADFIVTTQQQGAQTSNPPANNATKSYTREDIKNMTVDEINANYDAIRTSLQTKQ